MNSDKARDLFSEYREGSLSPSLREALERALASDAGLKSEFAHFDSVLRDFEATSARPVEVPFDLHDRIMARVDRTVFDSKRQRKAGWFSNWRLAWIGGLAVVAVVGGVLSLASGKLQSSLSSLVPTVAAPAAGFDVKFANGQLRVTHGAANTIVIVKEAVSGRLVQTYDLQGSPLDSPLSNENDHAVLLLVSAGRESLYVALPGRVRSEPTSGSGTKLDLAVALADVYGQPVKVTVSSPAAKVAWKLESESPLKSGSADEGYSVDVNDGVLSLRD